MKMYEIKKELECRLNIVCKEFHFEVYYDKLFDYFLIDVIYKTNTIQTFRFGSIMVNNDFKINNMILHIINEINHAIYNKLYNVEMIHKMERCMED